MIKPEATCTWPPAGPPNTARQVPSFVQTTSLVPSNHCAEVKFHVPAPPPLVEAVNVGSH
jgi:hypothetical protein